MNPENKTALALNFDPGEVTDVAVRKKYKDALIEAKAFEQFGGKVIKIKMKSIAAIGSDLDKLGAKKIGHGRIVVSAEDAASAIAICDERIAAYSEADPPVDPQIIVALLEVRLGYTRLMLDSGKAHIDAEKQLAAVNRTTSNIAMSFPQGQPMVVAVKATNSIEDTPPQG